MKNPLEDCVTTLVNFYGIRCDVYAIISELPSSKIINFNNLSYVAEKLDCNIKEVNCDINELKKIHVPVVVFLNNGETRIYFPESIGISQLYLPGTGLVDETLESIDNVYSGKIALFVPAKNKIQARIDHMLKGFAIDWFWEPVRKNWNSYAEILLSSLFINILVLALPLFTMNVYDRVISNFAEYTLIALTVGIVLALLFDFIFKITRSYILETLAADISTKYDSDLMERLLQIKIYAMKMSVGERVNIFRELQTIRDFFASRLIPMVVDLPFFILFCFIIYLISPPLSIIPVIGTLVILTINFAGKFAIGKSTKKYFSSMQNKTTVMVETLAGAPTIQMFNATGSRLFKWKFSSSCSAEAAKNNHILISFISNASFLVAHLVHVFIVVFGVYEIIDSNLTIGGLLACTIISGRAMAPVISSSGVIAQLKQSMDVLITIDNLFHQPYEKITSEKCSVKGNLKGGVMLRNVSARYSQQTRDALTDVSLLIKPNERIGIIGRTGAGKSTLIKAICGNVQIGGGQILFDNYNQSSISPTELRRIIALVPQDPFFFSGSIRDNVLLGEEMASEECLEKAIYYSGLDLVMQQTGDGLDTEVGENGSWLSGGQRQAISLARAFVRDSSILIFDEPTTGMDTVLENRLRTSMVEFLKERTFIMVTHRTSLLSLIDRLVLFDNGKIIADGPRDEVIKKVSNKN